MFSFDPNKTQYIYLFFAYAQFWGIMNEHRVFFVIPLLSVTIIKTIFEEI